MTVTFDSLTLAEPKVKPTVSPRVKETELVSGETKVTVSTKTKTAWQISCIATTAEKTALLAKVGYKKSLVIGSTTYTNCVIKSWKEDELNPDTFDLTLTFVQDTTT